MMNISTDPNLEPEFARCAWCDTVTDDWTHDGAPICGPCQRTRDEDEAV